MNYAQTSVNESCETAADTKYLKNVACESVQGSKKEEDGDGDVHASGVAPTMCFLLRARRPVSKCAGMPVCIPFPTA